MRALPGCKQKYNQNLPILGGQLDTSFVFPGPAKSHTMYRSKCAPQCKKPLPVNRHQLLCEAFGDFRHFRTRHVVENRLDPRPFYTCQPGEPESSSTTLKPCGYSKSPQGRQRPPVGRAVEERRSRSGCISVNGPTLVLRHQPLHATLIRFFAPEARSMIECWSKFNSTGRSHQEPPILMMAVSISDPRIQQQVTHE